MANQAKTVNVRPKRRKSLFGFKFTIYMFLVAGLLIAALPTTIVLAVGMIPTLVALIVDMTPGRYLMRCVAGLNVAGLSPFMHSLWSGDNSIAMAVGTVSDPFAWLVIYGASAIGWLLFMGLPGMVSVFQTLNAKRSIYILQDKQKQLLEEWGDSIRSPAELDKKGNSESTVEPLGDPLGHSAAK